MKAHVIVACCRVLVVVIICHLQKFRFVLAFVNPLKPPLKHGLFVLRSLFCINPLQLPLKNGSFSITHSSLMAAILQLPLCIISSSHLPAVASAARKHAREQHTSDRELTVVEPTLGVLCGWRHLLIS